MKPPFSVTVTLRSAGQLVGADRPFLGLWNTDTAREVQRRLLERFSQLEKVTLKRRYRRAKQSDPIAAHVAIQEWLLVLTFGNAVDAVAFRLRWCDDLDFEHQP